MRSNRLRRTLAPLGAVPGVRWIDRRARRAIFARDLRRLHDVLATTPLADRYAVTGGLLLGWARDGAILLDDIADADFTYFIDDANTFAFATTMLIAAGFQPAERFVNNDGVAVEHRFVRHHAQFEFFALYRIGDRVRYFMYDDTDELVCERLDRPFESFQFLGRTWRKPVDHAAALTANYGDWRAARTGWHHSQAQTIVARRPQRFGREPWVPEPGGAAVSPRPRGESKRSPPPRV